MNEPRVWLTAEEIAEQVRCSKMTIYRLIRSGQLRAVRLGRSYRVAQYDLDIYLEQQVVEGVQDAPK